MSFVSESDFITLAILIISCGLMLAGFSLRDKGVGPWIMLAGICSALAIIAYNILRHTNVLY